MEETKKYNNWGVYKTEVKEIPRKEFKVGQTIRTRDNRKGIVIGIYKNFIRVNITAGDKTYSECFRREELKNESISNRSAEI